MQAMDEWTVTTTFRAQLGEGLHWDAAHGVLWFVDILGRRVMRWRPDEPAWDEWPTPQRVGWVLPVEGSDWLLAGLQGGAALLHLQGSTLKWRWWAPMFEAHPTLRLNDAKADATGSVWAGSLNHQDQTRADGALFRIDGRGVVTQVDSGYLVANGPAIRPDGRLMLHTDSGRRVIHAFDLDAAAGRLSGKRVWRVFAEEEGYPDGMTFDAEGAVWVAHWGAGCVSRFAPDGTLLRRVALPAAHVTNVCFAGAALDRLFVTTATAGRTAEQLAAEPLAGGLFGIDTRGVRGLAGLPYRPADLEPTGGAWHEG